MHIRWEAGAEWHRVSTTVLWSHHKFPLQPISPAANKIVWVIYAISEKNVWCWRHPESSLTKLLPTKEHRAAYLALCWQSGIKYSPFNFLLMSHILKSLVFYNWTKSMCSQHQAGRGTVYKKQRDKWGTRGNLFFSPFHLEDELCIMRPLERNPIYRSAVMFAYHLYSSGPLALQTCPSRRGPSPTSVLKCAEAEQEISGHAAQGCWRSCRWTGSD